MCGMDLPFVILVLIIEVFVLGAFIVRAIARLKIDNPVNNKMQHPVKFDRVPPPRFVDQWIETHCPPADTKNEDAKILIVLVLLAIAVIAFVIIFFST